MFSLRQKPREPTRKLAARLRGADGYDPQLERLVRRHQQAAPPPGPPRPVPPPAPRNEPYGYD